GEEVGRVLAGIHRDKGVELITEDSVEAFEGSGRVERVRTKKGRVLECDLVVAGIGIVPNSELLATAGAQVDNGVLVDARCRTSLPDVFAAGDVTNHLHPIIGRLRVEHWNNGYQQGQAAARSLLGRAQPYDYIHSFWSDQYEHVIEYVGFAASWDRLVFRGQLESRKFLGFYLEGGVVRAAVGLNRGGDPEDPKVEGELKTAVKLIRNRTAVDPAKLADEAVDLHGLVVARARGRLPCRRGARGRSTPPGDRTNTSGVRLPLRSHGSCARCSRPAPGCSSSAAGKGATASSSPAADAM